MYVIRQIWYATAFSMTVGAHVQPGSWRRPAMGGKVAAHIGEMLLQICWPCRSLPPCFHPPLLSHATRSGVLWWWEVHTHKQSEVRDGGGRHAVPARHTACGPLKVLTRAFDTTFAPLSSLRIASKARCTSLHASTCSPWPPPPLPSLGPAWRRALRPAARWRPASLHRPPSLRLLRPPR